MFCAEPVSSHAFQYSLIFVVENHEIQKLFKNHEHVISLLVELSNHLKYFCYFNLTTPKLDRG